MTLRRDLNEQQADDHADRYRVIACEISGTFTRISADAWRRLHKGGGGADLRRMATQAGWWRNRAARSTSRFSLFAIRLPLFSADRLARWLAPRTDWLFAVKWLPWWIACGLFTIVALTCQFHALAADIRQLPDFLARQPPLLLVAVFAATKFIHELGHAAVCRRVGARCGSMGLWLFFGMPCPYCDVTDVWRLADAGKRMAVILAGIQVELVVAMIASWVWLLLDDPAWRLSAMNVMLVSGISTLVFNANPLLRYDGYYVLADHLGSVNLRGEAARMAASRIRLGMRSPVRLLRSLRNDRPTWLTAYHLASRSYQTLVLFGVCGLAVWAGETLQLRWLGIAIATLLAIGVARGIAYGLARCWSGRGEWRVVPATRRRVVLATGLAVSTVMTFLPIPRVSRVDGFLDLADAVPVYLPENTIVDQIHADFGERISAGQPILSGRNFMRSQNEGEAAAGYAIQRERWKVKRTIGRYDAAAKTSLTIQKTAMDESRRKWQFAKRQVDALNAESPVDGWIIPPISRLSPPETRGDTQRVRAVSLPRGAGERLSGDVAWCRVATERKPVARIRVPAQDRRHVRVGTKLRMTVETHPGVSWSGTVVAVSESDQKRSTSWQPAHFEVLCGFDVDPAAETPPDPLTDLGATVHASFRVPSQSLFQRMTDRLATFR